MSHKYYLTTPLYYVNSKPHIGHSYTNIAADTAARFHRLRGEEVLFLTGTDEHGQKVYKASLDAGVSPQEFTDRIVGSFKELWKSLDITYDDFIRTTEPRHIQAVKKVWQRLNEKGYIYQHNYDGYYCVPCETFVNDGLVETADGKKVCPECKRPVEIMQEENYFFKTSLFQDWLTQTLENKDGLGIQVYPESRKNEVLGFLRTNKLQDLCISRPKSRLVWGIESPLSPNHVTYVWFDALINYISACGYGQDEKRFSRFWPADVHLIGKDILKHHAIYWPVILKALDLQMPRLIFAHGWWVQGGEKMSKSRGNVVDPVEMVRTYGVDAYRYFLLREVPFGFDGVFSEEALVQRFNHDLANDLGNLLNRSLTMCEKYFEGQVPTADTQGSELLAAAGRLPEKLDASLSKLAFAEALSEIWAVINAANKHIETQAPWKLSKEGQTEALARVIAELMEVLKVTAQAVWPFMPNTGQAIWEQMGLEGSPAAALFNDKAIPFFKKPHKIRKGAPLFPRIETKKSA